LYLQLDDLARATQSLDELLKIDDNSALGHYYLGRARAKSKLYLAAEQSFRKALELNPKSEAVLMDLALLYELEGKTEEEIQTYQRLLQVNLAFGTMLLGRTLAGRTARRSATLPERLRASDPRDTRTPIGRPYPRKAI
jgi:Tfp pilus assembly protein PilF